VSVYVWRMQDDSLLISKYPSLKNLPNWLTLTRIGAVPVVIGLMLFLSPESADSPTGWNREISFLTGFVFALAAITDLVDGYLARKWDVVTTMGAFLDPLADKLIVLGTLVMLVQLDRVPAWIVIIILGREIAVTGLRSIAAEQGIVISAGALGKYKTIFQVIALLGLLVYYKYDYDEVSVTYAKVGGVFLYVALFFTVWSGIDYFAKFWAALSTNSDSGSSNPDKTLT